MPAQETVVDKLYESFQNPPSSARPRVWWHWLNGNITQEGIYKDLMWMNRAGIVGFQNFDANLETPQIVENRLVYMSPKWKETFQYAIHLADSLNFEMAIASSPGWSQTGGPWVSNEDAMKKLVWRYVDMEGNQKIQIKLPEGFDEIGKYQNQKFGEPSKKLYRDIAVIAIKKAEADKNLSQLNPTLTTNCGSKVTIEQLSNDDLMDYVKLTPGKDGYAWIQFEFKEPQTIQSMTSAIWKDTGSEREQILIEREIQSSQDGKNFETIMVLPKILEYHRHSILRTMNIPTTTAKYFRVRIKSAAKGNDANCHICVPMLILSPINQVELSAEKSGFAFNRFLAQYETPESQNVAKYENIIDLTHLVKNGILTWDVPSGSWRIFRFGYGLTGSRNGPASPEATGLEVDKMNPDAIRRYYKNYLDSYVEATQGMIGEKGITYILNDSFEGGAQTWTNDMVNEFQRRRGYNLLPWLPALTGMIINSTEETERFLFDWRRTIGEMITEYHYDLLSDILKDYNLKRYSESHEYLRANLTDGMDCKRYADIPMSSFWMHQKQKQSYLPKEEADIRESASIAHIYGQNIVAAESFSTDGVTEGALHYCPSNLKSTADAAMAFGLNRFVIHTSPHQPVDDKFPGLSLGKYGQWFTRHETWAEQAHAWTDYLSRSCYLLQQGQFVADIAYYYGEDNNLTCLYFNELPIHIKGYNYDFVNSSILLNVLKVENGMLTTQTGMKYRALYLDKNVKRMSMEVLKRIEELANAGVLICGAKPEHLANLQADEAEFKQIVDNIWNSGRRNVSTDIPVEEILTADGVTPDVQFTQTTQSDIRYVHRTLPKGEIYWIANLTDKAQPINVSFRVEGKKPQIWRADTGEKTYANYHISNHRTSVQLDLAPNDAVFVLFMEDTNLLSEQHPKSVETSITTITTPWNITFQDGRGAPKSMRLNQLVSYTESENEGIKYFSGTATYQNTFSIHKKYLKEKKQSRIWLDLGDVKDLAEVKVNGQNVGIIWKYPYKIDITAFIKSGKNALEVKVVNVWRNRLIGDAQSHIKEKITYTHFPYFKATDALLPAGLLGPVEILQESFLQ